MSDFVKINVPIRMLNGKLLLVGAKMSRQAFEEPDFRSTLIQSALDTYGVQLPAVVKLTPINEEESEFFLPEFTATR